MDIENLLKKYKTKKPVIKKRLEEFKDVWSQSDKRITAELCFCLCTPQSSALNCWNSISKIFENNLLFSGSLEDIEKNLTGVRFSRNKAGYILAAREIKIKEKLENKNPKEMREWVVDNIKGLGWKESSHFLRNVGFGKDLAILDRHILKNLVKFGIIKEIPKTITKKKYLEIENKMRKFSEKINIPMDHLDLLFWSIETGKIFK